VVLINLCGDRIFFAPTLFFHDVLRAIVDGLNFGTSETWTLAGTLNLGLVAEASPSLRPPSTGMAISVEAVAVFVGFVFSFQFFTRPVAIG
jgi:hypothetical protein